MFDLLTSAKGVFKSNTSVQNKQLLLHFIFEKLELKEGVISYKLKSPFCYTKVDSSMSSMSPVSAKSAKNWELIENTELNGKSTTISGNLDEDVWEPCGSVENKGLSACCENPVQYGCFTLDSARAKALRIFRLTAQDLRWLPPLSHRHRQCFAGDSPNHLVLHLK